MLQVTNAVFVQLPPPLGYGFTQFATAGVYGTPIVSELPNEHNFYAIERLYVPGCRNNRRTSGSILQRLGHEIQHSS